MFGKRRRKDFTSDTPRSRRTPAYGDQPQRSQVFSYYSGARQARPSSASVKNKPLPSTKQAGSQPRSGLWTNVRRRIARVELRQVPSLIALGAILIGVIWVLGLSRSPRIIVRDVEGVSTQKDAQQYNDEVTRLWAGSWRNLSKLTVDSAATEQDILKAYPELAAANIQIPLLGRQPTIELIPTAAVLVVESSGNASYVGADGKVLTDNLPNSSGANLLRVRDETNVTFAPGDQVMPSDHVRFLLQLDAQLRADGVTSPSLALSNEAANQVTMKTSDHAYYVKFQADNPETVRRAVGSYLAVRRRAESGAGARPGEYIDVRIPEKVFYK